MSDLTKIGTSMLEMDDVAEYLDVAKKFVTQEQLENAPVGGKVTKVAGVSSSLVAQAVSPDNRTTVNNALNLNGHPDAYFMGEEEGSRLVSGVMGVAENIKNTYATEISELRDEVYQLRMELSKSGAVTGYAPYAGFYDMFRRNNPVHEYGVIAVPTKDSADRYHITTDSASYGNFFTGDIIMLKNTETGETCVAGISEMTADMETLVLDRAVSFDIKKDITEIYKSKGNIINGTFTFGEITEIKPSNRELYSCLDDDTFRLRRSIKESNTGYATTFRIPAINQKNFLKSIDIQVRKYGSPGALMCYVIDERDIAGWKNIGQAVTDNDSANTSSYENTKFHFFAKSKPLVVDADKGEYLASFDFVTSDDGYPLLDDIDTTDHKVRFCMIVEALNADSSNYYDILFLQTKNETTGTYGDLQMNNITYTYAQVATDSAEQALVTSDAINRADMYYGITLLKAIEEAFTPYENGIYSARFTVPEPVRAGGARMMLRVAREGIFSLDGSGTQQLGDLGDLAVIAAKGETNDDVDGFTSVGKNYVVIGDTFRRIANVSGELLTVEKGLSVSAGAEVYPASYKAVLNCRLKEWDSDSCKTVIRDKARYNLNLAHVMPDRYKKSNKISDRLIFTADFNEEDELKKFNDFEIQLYWEKSAKAVSERIAGRIHDITINLDRKC